VILLCTTSLNMKHAQVDIFASTYVIQWSTLRSWPFPRKRSYLGS
jgi:hypothetical protein